MTLFRSNLKYTKSAIVSEFLKTHKSWFEDSFNEMFDKEAEMRKFLDCWAQTGRFPQTTNHLEIYIQVKFEEWLESRWESCYE